MQEQHPSSCFDHRFSSQSLLQRCRSERRRGRAAWILAGATLCLSLDLNATFQAELISRPPNPGFFGIYGALPSGTTGCSLSDSATRVAFSTDAFNLFEDDLNRASDVVVHDLVSGRLFPVSVTSSGQLADGASRRPAINGDGRYVLFESDAANLGGSGTPRIYRHDLQTEQTVLISLDPGGLPLTTTSNAQDLSDDGNLALFTSDSQVWLRDVTLGQTELLSIGVDGLPADTFATDARIAGQGGFVVFESAATNLVAADANGQRDVFVFDRGLAALDRIVGLAGAEPDGASTDPQISADGRWIVFSSTASNLVPGDTEGVTDVFLHERPSGATIRLSQDDFGVGGNGFSQRPQISADGRFVVFESRATNLAPGLSGDVTRLFLYDRVLERLDRIAADGFSPSSPCIASDGDEVAIGYVVREHPLLPPGSTPSQVLVERMTRPNRATAPRSLPAPAGAGPIDVEVASRRVPPLPVDVANGPSDTPIASINGEYLAFRTSAENLVGQVGFRNQIVRLDLGSGQIAPVSITLDGSFDATWLPANPSISGNGNRVAFNSRSSLLVGSDGNDTDDVFVRDLQLGQTRRVSVDSGGAEANAGSIRPQISANGNSIAFESTATNLVPGDNNARRDVFVHDLDSGLTERVSISTAGAEADRDSDFPSISADGRLIVFESRGSLLDDPTTITSSQIWLRDRQFGTTELVSAAPDGTPGDGSSSNAKLSAGGRWIVFESSAGNLDPAFPGFDSAAIYLHDRQLGTTRLISLDENQQPFTGSLLGELQFAAGGQAVIFLRQDAGGMPNAAPRGTQPAEVFLHRIDLQQTLRIDPRTVDGLPPDEPVLSAALNVNGRLVYLVSEAGNLVSGMLNADADIYRIDLDRVFGDGFEG